MNRYTIYYIKDGSPNMVYVLGLNIFDAISKLNLLSGKFCL